MLTTDTSQGTTSAKTICLNTTAASTVLYTVPPGKTFFGKIIIGSNAQAAVNGVLIFAGSGVMENVELTAGTTVMNYSTGGISIIGVEK